MSKIATETAKKSRTVYSSLDRFAESYTSVRASLFDPEQCLEILADTIRYEAKEGVAPLSDESDDAVEHWEGHYFDLIASGLDNIARSGRGAGPINMIAMRSRAIAQLAPFMRPQEVKNFELVYDSHAIQSRLKNLDDLANMAGFSRLTAGLELAEELLPSERQYEGE